MTDFASGSASIADLYKRIGHYQSSPVRIMGPTLDFLDDVLNNRVQIVDPTNPFILLLETSAVQTAMAVNESLLNVRRGAIGLADTNQDVYRHMTDDEFVGRFAIPGKANMLFIMELSSLLNSMVEDPREDCLKAIIPRDTFITVDIYTFTLQYPIVLRKFPNGTVQASYDTTIDSPISQPSNNLIPVVITGSSDGTNTKYITFTVPLEQMKIETSNYAIQREAIFSKTIAFADQFVYARVFQKSDSNADWVPMYSTYSDQIFDKNTPTAVLAVTDGQLNVSIPYIYNTLGSVSGSIRIDVYTSKGDLNVNFSTYTQDKFLTSFRNIDTIRDDSVYSSVWGTVNYQAMTGDVLSGGSNEADFATLRSKVINYAFGNPNIPITPAQLQTVGQVYGFTIVPNADALTDRVMLGTRAIPDISIQDTNTNAQKLLTRANIGMIRFTSSLKDLEASDNIINNDGRLTMRSGTSFLLDNGQATLVAAADIATTKSRTPANLIPIVNAIDYTYTPFYYLFDLDQKFLNVRPYDLDHPSAGNLNFILQNQTLQLGVNTGSYGIVKTPTGYQLTIVTRSTSFYKQLNDGEVAVQLQLRSAIDDNVGSINGILNGIDPDTSERVYTFDIQTNYNIDPNNNIQITNAKDTSDSILPQLFVSLDSVVDIIYTTTSVIGGYVADATDGLVNKAILPGGSVGNNHDTVEIFFGEYLEHLWTRARSYAAGITYQKATSNIPALYTDDVYQIDAVTGSMLDMTDPLNPTYHKLHGAGEPVLDFSNSPAASNNNVSGNGPPSNVEDDPNNIGAVNDYYVDRDTGDYYGPKDQTTGWPSTTVPGVSPIPVTYKYVIGDTILDSDGNPVPIDAPGSSLTALNDFDILTIDGAMLFATDPSYVSYRDQVATIMSGWITSDILEIQARLIERTDIFFYPQTGLGLTQIVTPIGQTVSIPSEQSLSVEVYLDKSIAGDLGVQTAISTIINKYLDIAVTQTKFTLNQLESDLKVAAGNNTYGVSISGLGGNANYKAINVTDQHNRLSIKRVLVLNPDNTITIQPDINIQFIGI